MDAKESVSTSCDNTINYVIKFLTSIINKKSHSLKETLVQLDRTEFTRSIETEACTRSDLPKGIKKYDIDLGVQKKNTFIG